MTREDIPVIVSRIDARQLARRGKPVVLETIVRFGDEAVDVTGVDLVFNVSHSRVNDYVAKWSAKRVVGINRTTERRVRKVLLRALEESWDYTKTGKQIGRVFQVARTSRLVAIARTEINTASNFASQEGYQQAGIEQKQWQHTSGGPMQRADHAEMDGQIVGINEDFVSPDGATAPYPGGFGDPAHDVNCQCGVLPVVENRMLSPRARQKVVRVLARWRQPYEKRMRIAFRAGFTAQEEAVMDQLSATFGESLAA